MTRNDLLHDENRTTSAVRVSTQRAARPARTWVVAHDLTHDSDEAAREALDELIEMGVPAVLVLLHVLDPLPARSLLAGLALAPPFPAGLGDAARIDAEQQLDAVAADLWARASIESARVVIARHLVVGAPADAIVRYADEQRAERIVLATHGLRGAARYVVGSVSETVARTAKAPVLVIHPRAAEAPSSHHDTNGAAP